MNQGMTLLVELGNQCDHDNIIISIDFIIYQKVWLYFVQKSKIFLFVWHKSTNVQLAKIYEILKYIQLIDNNIKQDIVKYTLSIF